MSYTKLDDVVRGIAPLDEGSMRAAEARQATLTKPAGSLGRLDREMLRDALHVIKEFRESIARSFRLST